MNVLIAGGTGFIGSALVRSLLADGHAPWILTRNEQPVGVPAGARFLRWDGKTSQGWLDAFPHMDAVVNLAGSTIGAWPWSASRKRNILSSRVQAGQALAEAFQKSSKKPGVLIQSSGVGYYGPQGDQPVTETSPAGNDFLAQVAVAWENSTASVADMGIRRCVIRTAVVLDPKYGAFPMMALPVQLFAGGPLGNGRQGISWIHIDDQVRAIRFLMENPQAEGNFNLSSPNPVSNADFMRQLARATRRPYWLPAPAFAMRLILGGMSTLLLDGQFALPARLTGLGFNFKFETLQEAFANFYTS